MEIIIRLDECFECGEPSEEMHHVIPVIRGGKKMIPLCSECHGKAHGIGNRGGHSKLIKEGIEKAKKEGNVGGRPRIDKEKQNEIKRMKELGYSNRKIARELKISNRTVGFYIV